MTKITLKELDSVDINIKGIIAEINELPFIEKTHFSCEGHPTRPYVEDLSMDPYVTIEYKDDPTFTSTINTFRRDMTSVPFFYEEEEGKITKNIYRYLVTRIPILNRIFPSPDGCIYYYRTHTDTEKDILWDSITQVIDKFKRY